ncbi:hypothetical protein BDV29DRAFT_163080 [Aspergillus leporis]|uniref:Uncharacterized protein n=1 Tax=Aspergillus leporis TaxID=41062 RepID=A0A5N5WH45_9EURO|nr:hypothetical protein BDV29DRAFT_163080 [Aspergillus leporis]
MASQTIHVKITLKIPLENHLIEDLTLRLKEVHREIVLVSTDPASGAVFFNCPASDQHYLNALALFLAPFTVSFPISENPAGVARARLEKRVTWSFNCYSPGQACRGRGDTSGGRESPGGCSPISFNGCARFSFNGGGEFRLTGYPNRQCTGQEIIHVNGGSITCIDAPGNWSGYFVTKI